MNPDEKIREEIRRFLLEDLDEGPEKIPPAIADLARYEFRGAIGEGGSATVHKAWDRELARPVAIKILRDAAGAHETLRHRFRREAQTVAALSHTNVVAVHDVGEKSGRLYLVMELVEGRSLRALLEDRDRKPQDLVKLLHKVCLGVGAAHHKGIVHRDLKPGNILVTPAGEPKVADFGLAYLMEAETASLTRTGQAVGTPLYMSPEQVRSDGKSISPRTDVHALGVILYEAVTGAPPFMGRTVTEIYAQILDRDPEPPRQIRPEIHKDLENIILKALEKDPDRRYADADEMARELERYLNREPILARSRTMLDRIQGRYRRNPAAWIIAGVAALALIVATMFAVRSNQSTLALEDADLASQISGAYYELNLATLESMRTLEDHWHGANPGIDTGKCLREIEEGVRPVRTRFPKSQLVPAWKGLASFFAGRPEGLPELVEASKNAGEDPFPPILLARARMAMYAREARLEWLWAAGDARPAPHFVESAGMTTARREAGTALERAVSRRIWPKLPQYSEIQAYAMGVAQLAMQKYDKAAEILADVKAVPLVHAEAALLRGFAHYATGRYPEAAAAWELPSSRGWIKGLLFAGLAHATTGNHEAAEKKFDAVIARDPSFAKAYLYRGLVHKYRADNRRAIADFSQSLQRDPDDEWSLFYRATTRLALVGEEEDVFALLDASRTDLDAAIQLNPESPINYNARGIVGSMRGEADHRAQRDPAASFAASLADFNRSLALNPDYLPAVHGRAACHRLKGDAEPDPRSSYEAAVADYLRWLESSPADWQSRSYVGFLFDRLGRADEAEAAYEAALKLKPDLPQVRQLLDELRRRKN